MKVRDLRGVILNSVQLYFEASCEDGGVHNYHLCESCGSNEISEQFCDLEVKCIFSLDTEDLLYVEVVPELPFSEEVME